MPDVRRTLRAATTDG